MKNIKDNKLIIFVALLFVITLVVVGSILYSKNKSLDNNSGKNRTEVRQVTIPQATKEYPKMEEKSSTPKEVNNQVVDELDTLIKDIDTDTQDNLNDLSL